MAERLPRSEVLAPLLNLANLKTLFDLSWKGIPVLWVAFQFYSNANDAGKRASANESRILKLETDVNKMDREIVAIRSEYNARREQEQNDRQFYLQTQRRK